MIPPINMQMLTQLLSSYQVFMGIGLGFGLGLLLKVNLFEDETDEGVSDDEWEKEELNNVKLVVAVRTDLKMGKGKVAAQVSHGVLKAYKKMYKNSPRLLYAWESQGQPKVIVKIEDEETMLELELAAQEIGLMTSIIQDAGRTQVAPGSKTVMAIGPAPSALIDEVTAKLPEY